MLGSFPIVAWGLAGMVGAVARAMRFVLPVPRGRVVLGPAAAEMLVETASWPPTTPPASEVGGVSFASSFGCRGDGGGGEGACTLASSCDRGAGADGPGEGWGSDGEDSVCSCRSEASMSSFVSVDSAPL